ncbi:hypothetical protein [Endozoicomonas montiporae]|uniref:hypothetical protein n=1 Tax=Endozoicomonas montiporae TaxID=1027273 RepID=UPI0012680091|nr:hypothetical protein [Endozoicomonas montiporae]
MSKPTIDTGWQHTPTGKGFSVTRMILEEPPFKKSVEGAGNLSRPAVFYMNRTTLKELKTTYSLWERSRSEFSPGPGELESTDTLRTFRTAATSSTFSTALGASFGMQEDNHLDDSNSMQGQHAYIRNQPSNHPSFEHMTDQFFHWLHQQCPNPNTSWLMPESVQGDEKITVPAGRYNTPPHAEQIGLISKGGDVSEEFSWPAPKKSLIREGIDEEAVLIDTELMKQLFKEFLESRTQSELKPPIAQRSLARNG